MTTYMQFNAVKCLFYYVVGVTYNYHGGIICDVEPNNYNLLSLSLFEICQ